MSRKHKYNWYSFFLWLTLFICMAVVIGTAESSYAANSAPVWRSGAIAEDTATITKGNPYTPTEYITAKWVDPEEDDLTYYYSIDSGEPELCADYIGAESQLPWFAYTFKKTGTFVLKVWASDGKLDSEPYVATVTVVDPATHEYTMTIKAAPRNVDLEFFTFEGYDEDGYDIPGTKLRATNKGRDDNYHTYEIKLTGGTYCFRGKDTAGNNLGGMTFNVPNEANTAGASETGIIVRELDIACSTKYDGVNYCTDDHFRPVISRSGHNSTLGDTYVSSGMTYYRTMVIASGNDMVYQHYLEATLEAEALGYTDGGANESYTPSAGGSALKLQLDLSRFWEATFNVPEDSDVRIYFRRSYYSFIDKTEKRFVSKVNNGDGTETWKFTVPNQTLTYSWRVSKEGRLTKAGYFSQTNRVIDLTGEDKASPESTVTDVGADCIDNSIMLNVNGRNALELSVGESFSLKAYRVWEIIKSSGGNDMIEPDFHTEIISGDDVIDVREETLGNAGNNKAVITAKKEGLAIIRVTYDALDIYGGEDSGVYGACDEAREGIVAVKVGSKNASDIKYHITGEVSRKTEWDVEFDTCYFFGDTGTLKAAPETDGVITSVSISDPEELNWTELTSEEGAYSIPVKPGNNLLRVVTDNGEIFYQMIRGCRYSTTVTNLSREGEEPAVGDTVKIHLDGLYMPVPKMSGVYNPGYGGTGRVIYQDEEGNTVEAPGAQYNFIAKQDLTLTISEYSDGEYTLDGGHMFINIMGPPDPIGKHREIPDGGLNRMFNAVSRAWRGSTLEDIKIRVAETGKGLWFKGMLPGSLVELTDHNGTTLVPKYDVDEVLFEELPDGSYEYRVTLAGFQDVAGSIEITESDSGFKEISIIQKANDPAVQLVIDRITALPDEDDLTKADIESVEAVKEAYNSLSAEQQAFIRDELKEKLEKLLHAVAILKDEDVMNVFSLIKALPDAQDISLDDKDQVEQAEFAFNSLTEEQKALVDEVYQRKLGNAVSRIVQLIAEKKDQDAASAAVSLIQGLPVLENLTLDDSEEVARVKSYYDSLTRAQKALIPDSFKLDLQDAVERIAELRSQAEEEERIRKEKKKELIKRISTAKAAKTKIKIKALKKRKLRITWRKISGVTGYMIYRAAKKNGKYKLIKIVKRAGTRKYINKKLKKGRKYFYKIKPYTRLGGKVYHGKWSNIVKIKAR